MAARGKSIACPECDAFVFANEQTCAQCGWVNTNAGRTSSTCQFSIGDMRCPLPATCDRRWCRFHMEPCDRENTEGTRHVLREICANPRKILLSTFQGPGKDALVTDRIDPDWHRREGESRKDFVLRMRPMRDALLGKISARMGGELTPDDRARIQREAAERRIPAIRVHDIADVTDQFEVELERLIASGLSHEQAAGLAFEATLEARLKA